VARTLQILRQSRVTFVYPTNHVPKNRELDVTRGKVGLLARRQKVIGIFFRRTFLKNPRPLCATCEIFQLHRGRTPSYPWAVPANHRTHAVRGNRPLLTLIFASQKKYTNLVAGGLGASHRKVLILRRPEGLGAILTLVQSCRHTTRMANADEFRSQCP